MLLGFIPGPKELDLPLLGFDFVLVLLEFLLGCDVWVSHRLGKENRKLWKLIARKKAYCFCVWALVSISIIPAWLCGVCEPLASVKTPSGQQRKPERISPAPLVSSAARSALAPGSSEWDLDIDESLRFISLFCIFPT